MRFSCCPYVTNMKKINRLINKGFFYFFNLRINKIEQNLLKNFNKGAFDR